MTTPSEPPQYAVGSVVNGHVWTGTEWLPLAQQTPPAQARPRSQGRTIAGVAALIVAGLAGMQGLSWMSGYSDLTSKGNQFAGMLAVLGMGALAVAAAFGIAGIVLLTKKS